MSTVYQTITFSTSGAHGLSVGNVVVVAGVTPSAYNGTWTVSSIVSNTSFKVTYNSSVNPGVGTVFGTVTSQGPALSRSNNVVTAVTSAAHGFTAGLQVVVSGIANKSVGGGILAAPSGTSRDGQGTVTVTTTSAHGLVAGETVTITGVTDTTFNGTFVITSVPSATTFTYAQTGAAATSGGGNAQEVWNGTFFITGVPSSTTFTYTQIGPTDVSSGTGTATITAQMVSGQRKVVVLFQTRQGNVTAPSAPVTFTSSGGQLLSLTNIPIGPANVTGRILAFTGANGGTYFYIPVTPSGGGTATLIGDNTTTSALIDFSDNTLFAASGIDIAGNNLFALQTLGEAVGFFPYASRLMAWGERNRVSNLINLSFDGGYVSGTLTTPLGWTVATAGGALVNGGAWASGMAWQITGDGTGNAKGQITQSAYQDINGISILAAGTAYTFRCYAKKSNGATLGSLICDIYSVTGGGVLATATVAISGVTTAGGYVSANFAQNTPSSIPADTVLRLYCQNQANNDTLTVDEGEVIFTNQPYRDNTYRVSYVNAPEQFDGVTGVLGPASDPNPLRATFGLRDNLYILTSKRLHTTKDSAGVEPAGWSINELERNVGALSFRSLTSYEDENAGESWAMWATRTGARIFDGGQSYKASQEIQTIWDSINLAHQEAVWVTNDIDNKRCYFGVPTGANTTPNLALVLDYRELDTAYQVSVSAPIHISFTGKMIATDLARKWTKWNVSARCGALIQRAGNAIEMCFGSGGVGYGNLYYLDSAKLTDDDYGQINPYYVTFAFINHEAEMALGTGSHRKLYAYITAFVSGTGTLTITPLVDSLTNAWAATPAYTLSATPSYDLEWGLNVTAERCFFKFASAPLTGTDNGFNLQKMVVSMRQDAWMPIRGAI